MMMMSLTPGLCHFSVSTMVSPGPWKWAWTGDALKAGHPEGDPAGVQYVLYCAVYEGGLTYGPTSGILSDASIDIKTERRNRTLIERAPQLLKLLEKYMNEDLSTSNWANRYRREIFDELQLIAGEPLMVKDSFAIES
jgi:hypothetical protein